MRRNTLISFLSLLTISCMCFSQTAGVKTQKLVRLRGMVVDLNNSAVPETELILSGKNVERKIVTDDDGEFEAEVPAGIYSIMTKAIDGTLHVNGFLPYRRAPFRV